MSVLLIGSAVVTTMLIPAGRVPAGRRRPNGRALAYLAHATSARSFGTVYDVSTIAILWFAGASAMAGLLNLVPRYLPRYGMAPDWARATRPLVLLITAITFVVTIIFDADVDAQGGAYATGVLVLMTLGGRRRRRSRTGAERSRWRSCRSPLVFVYTTIANIFERPEGIKIASWFIVTIVVTSLISRVLRSTELRIEGVEYDDTAQALHPARPAAGARSASSPTGPTPGGTTSTQRKLRRGQRVAPPAAGRPGALPRGPAGRRVGVHRGCCTCAACDVGGYPRAALLEPGHSRTRSPALLLDLRDRTGTIPHAYFGWTEGNPIAYLLKFLAFGEGDTAPVTREVLRQAEHDPAAAAPHPRRVTIYM